MTKRGLPASPILGAAAALIGEASASLVTRDTRFRHTFEAPIVDIDPQTEQPRRRFDQRELAALAATMAERGQLQPILLRRHPAAAGRWLIVAGERRWRAARLNAWSTILAIEHDGDPEVAGLIENLQRVDLTPVEEARGLKQLIACNGWTQSAAAVALGKSKADVSAVLRILSLPDSVLDAVLTSELEVPKNVLIELARIDDAGLRDRLLELARQGELTVRAIREAEVRLKASIPANGSEPCTSRPRRERGIAGIDSLAQRLRNARILGHAPSDVERGRLTRLRMEIDQILGNG
jgi:ParB family transcriptional regulator, chromosome partitioning protein